MDPFVPQKLPLDSLDWARFIRPIGLAHAALARYDGILQGIVNPQVLLSPLTTQEAVLSSRIRERRAGPHRRGLGVCRVAGHHRGETDCGSLMAHKFGCVPKSQEFGTQIHLRVTDGAQPGFLCATSRVLAHQCLTAIKATVVRTSTWHKLCFVCGSRIEHNGFCGSENDFRESQADLWRIDEKQKNFGNQIHRP